MITGTIKSQIDQIWNAFATGGISNPLEVIEQISVVEKLKLSYKLSLADQDVFFASLQHHAFCGEL